jgi:cytochrome b
MTRKRLVYLSAVLLAFVAILSIQPWFEVELATGTELLIEGNAVYPAVSAALLVDMLAIALFLYLQSRWGAVFLIAAALALCWSFAPTVAVLLGADAAVLEPFVAKSTGIANWVAQLDEVVLSHQTTFSGLSAVVLAAIVTLLQIYTALVSMKRVLSKVRERAATKSTKSKTTVDNTQALEQSLWQETNPNHK